MRSKIHLNKLFRLALLGITLSLHPIELISQSKYTASIQEAHHAILSLNFTKAEQLLDQEKRGAASIWLKSYASFINFLTTSEISNPRELIVFYDAQTTLLSAEEPSSIVTLGMADNYLFKAYTHLTLKEYLWAGTSYIKAQRQFSKLLASDPSFMANARNQLIQIMADSWMTENLPFVNRVKDIEQAKKQYNGHINQCLKNDATPATFKREMKIVSILLLPYIEQDAESIYQQSIRYGSNWSTEGPIENLAFSNCCQKAKHYPEAKKCLTQGEYLAYSQQFNRLNLLLGNAYLNQINDSAINYYISFNEAQKNTNTRAYCLLKQAWFFKIKNENANYNKALNELQLVKEVFTPEDEQAKYEVQFSTYWNKPLLTARILFDGGNYKKSLSNLDSAKQFYPTYHAYQKITYHYQLARTYHLLNKPSKAKLEYQNVIDIDLQDTFYFSAYAYYFLGSLFEEENDTTSATASYNACLSCDSPIYKASIHRKAKLKLE